MDYERIDSLNKDAISMESFGASSKCFEATITVSGKDLSNH